jgi:hypothetical protein
VNVDGRPTALVLTAFVLAGCGEERVSQSERRDLPTEQLVLASELCPEEWDEMNLPPRDVRRQQARGRRQLAALKASYAEHPDAVVETTYESHDGETVKEDNTIRELARSHLDGVTEFGTPKHACLLYVAHELRALLAD